MPICALQRFIGALTLRSGGPRRTFAGMTMGVPVATELPATRIERFFIIVNVRAGGVRKRPWFVRDLQHAVGSRGEVLATTTSEELASAVARAKSAGADAIGICGGDGSNVHALSAIARCWADAQWPLLSLLPAGTLNTAATNLGIRRMQPAGLVRAILASDEPRTQTRPLVQANDLFGFIFGGQMVARVLDAYYAGRTGPVGAAWLAARIIGSTAWNGPFARDLFAADAVECSIDEGPWLQHQLTTLLAATVAAPAVKLRAMPRAGENGCFQMIGAECSPTKIMPEIGRVFAGLPLEALSIDVLAKQVRLRMGEKARWTVDGDIFEGSDVTLRATKPVRLLLP